jgi:mRNA-degrading endonuclease HigB of HigAB toxin-antitoxin module
MQNKLHESLRKIIQQEIAAALQEASTQTYSLEITAKNGKKTISKVPAESPVELNRIVTALKKSKNVSGVKVLKVEGSISEGPEEMGAYRRLVITSSELEKMKTEMTKFMNRADIKSMYPVRFKMIDSPKPNTVVVDVEGDKATVVATKLSDLAKKLDKSVAIMVRKERKLK